MKVIKFVLVLALISGVIYLSSAQQKDVNEEKGIAVQGYDPVAYFTEGKAIEGSKSIVAYFEGVRYYFSSSENMKKFKGNPGKYVPAYGGWCAYAMAEGEKVKVDPETFKIIDGKLYLFYNFYFTNTLTKWNQDEPALKKKADLAWDQLTK